MNEKIESPQGFGHYEWKQEFHKYYENLEINSFLINVMSELKKLGWPEEEDPVDYDDFKSILVKSSNKRIRLIAISNRLSSYRDDLKKIYENIVFFLKSDPMTKGKIKEEKKKYAELDLYDEILILNRIDKVLKRILDLAESYKIKYDSTSRVLSIVEYERKQASQELIQGELKR